MVGNTVSHVSPSRRNENLLVPHKKIVVQIRRHATARRQLWKLANIFATLLIGLAALDPDALGIPLVLRPWVFVAFIFWFFVFCVGILNP